MNAASHCQNSSRHDAGHGVRQDNSSNRLPFAAAASIGAFAHGIRHGGQRFFRSYDHDRQREQRQGKRSPYERPFAKHRVIVGHARGIEDLIDRRPAHIAKET